jgi:hypothetical protein
VQREHADVGKPGCGRDSTCDGVWDVVELQIEEDIGAETREPLYGLRALGCEELFADLKKASYAAKSPRQGASPPQAVHIEGND